MFEDKEDRKPGSLTDGWEVKGDASVGPVKSGYQTPALCSRASSVFSEECRGQDTVRGRGKQDTSGE